MSWRVYLLLSNSIDLIRRSYVGITTDVNRRLKQHNGELVGGAKSTRINRPYEVAYVIDNINNRSIASKIEHDIKQKKGFDNRFKYMQDYEKQHKQHKQHKEDLK